MVSIVEAVTSALVAGYSLTDCANALGMHRISLWKELKRENSDFRVYPGYTIEEVCEVITREVPIDGYARDWGIRFVKTKLQMLGHRVSRNSVRDAMEELLPGVLNGRARTCISRRIYDVTEPMQVWHMDSYDKLARWGFRFHGAIDGASHFVVYMKVALNKKAPTIYSAYKSAIDKYGHPSTIRSDYATEHSLVRRDLERARPGTLCYRTGSSVHNQRIEAFWRHMRDKATQYFKDCLHDLSYVEGLLELDDPLHRSCMVRVVRNGGRERPSHIPTLTFQAAEREAGIVLPPPYAEGVNLREEDVVDEVVAVGRDTWNHNGDLGNFEEGMRDLEDEALRNVRDAAHQNCARTTVCAKKKLRMHLLLSLECERFAARGLPLNEYLHRECQSPGLSYDRRWALSKLQRTIS